VATGALVFDAVLNTILSEAEQALEVTLTVQQRAAVIQAFQHSVSIVTGGPGTGKSTLVKVLVQVAARLQQSIALCAPFGRAGKNLANITGHPASTIHRLLEYSPNQGGWQRNSENPLEEDIVVADEWSTADLELAFRLFDGCALSTNILLIGDDNQLPSVGAGRVLNDMIQSGRIPVTRLDRVHRQAEQSQIIRNAHRVLTGLMPVFPPGSDSELIQPPASITEAGARAAWA
jgi:exodeoxyribonuclease V alpha subunit